jgi:hypothetical protein
MADTKNMIWPSLIFYSQPNIRDSQRIAGEAKMPSVVPYQLAGMYIAVQGLRLPIHHFADAFPAGSLVAEQAGVCRVAKTAAVSENAHYCVLPVIGKFRFREPINHVLLRRLFFPCLRQAPVGLSAGLPSGRFASSTGCRMCDRPCHLSIDTIGFYKAILLPG